MREDIAPKIDAAEIVALISNELGKEFKYDHRGVLSGAEDAASLNKNHIYNETAIFKIYKAFKRLLQKFGLYNLFLPILYKINRLAPASLRYTVNIDLRELLQFNGIKFIENLYEIILDREAGQEELDFYHGLLLSAKYSKIDIIGFILHSEEGKASGKKVDGYKLKYFARKIIRTIFRIPILGYTAKIFYNFLLLPNTILQLQKYNLDNTYHFNRLKEEKSWLVSDFDQLRQQQAALLQMIESSDILLNNNKSLIEKLNTDLNADRAVMIDLEKHVKELEANLEQNVNDIMHALDDITKGLERNFKQNVNDIMQSLEDVELNIEILRNSISLNETNLRNSITNTEEAIYRLDKIQEVGLEIDQSIYVKFEDAFRGSREDVKNRLYIYGRYIENLANKEDAMLLDIGCGRGEWLEYLKEAGVNAKGIDLNESMSNYCGLIGLDVQAYDCIKYLQESPAGMFDAITGFQIVEHLPFKTMFYLFKLCFNALKEKGFVLFESPNLDNILVAASTFYKDPSHINRLTPDVYKFYLEQAGFLNVEIIIANKRDEPEYTGNKYVDEVVYKLNMEQDFAIVGYKI